MRIRPEWQDPGDGEFEWYAIEDEDGGRVCIRPVMDLPIPPNSIVTTKMVERVSAEGDTRE